MKRFLILTSILMASCTLPSQLGEDQIDRYIPATFYTVPSTYLSGHDEVVIVSTPTTDLGRVHVERNPRVRYRQLYVGTIRMHAGRVWIADHKKGVTTYSNQRHETRQAVIDEIKFPSIVLSGREFDIEKFMLDYRSSPPYWEGDTVTVVTSFFDLEAVL